MTRLAGRRIVVVEDNYFLAMEVKSVLEGAGAAVLGPFPTVANAGPTMLHDPPDCAVLDVNLGEGDSLDLARTLQASEIPFVFFTGYDAKALPPEFGDVERVEKPVDPARLIRAIEASCRSARSPP